MTLSDRARSRLGTVAIVAAMILGLTVIWAFRFRGWYAHDEGTLGQSAERILRGQVPHRDFDDPYTGGLGYLHALVFRFGGISMNALRDHLALVASVWFGGVFWLLTRWLKPIGAAVVAAMIAVFSVPLYPAAMPSWYVLFLTCAAGGVLVMWPQHRTRAAFVAGLLVGIAMLAKITAIFALAGTAWALVALRQEEDRERRGSVEIVAAAALFIFLVARLVSALVTDRVVAHLSVPPILVVAAIGWHEVRQGKGRGFGLDLELWRRVGAIVAGVALPVAVYALWLAQHDALVPLLASLHAVVGKRAASASAPPPSVFSILYALPVVAILFGAGKWFGIRPFFLAAGGLTLAMLAWFQPQVHAGIWNALRGLLPVGAVFFLGVWGAGRGALAATLRMCRPGGGGSLATRMSHGVRSARSGDRLSSIRSVAVRAPTPAPAIRGASGPHAPEPPDPASAAAPTALRALLVFVPLTAMMVLTQFPFAAPIYFLYVLPLLIIAASAAVSLRPAPTQRSAAILAFLYLLFGLVEAIPGSPDSLAEYADHSPDLTWLVTTRGRLLIPSDFADLYHRLTVAMDSVPPGPVWAGPDAPDVAFLTGRVDLNRSFFSVLGREEPPGIDLARRMAAAGARAIVVDLEPSFSTQLTDEALDSVTRYFPHMSKVDRFEIHWRERTP